MSKKENILELAKELVSNDREGTHLVMLNKIMNRLQNFGIYILDKKLKPVAAITCDDVATMMALLKISRSTQGEMNMDDYIDGAAYLAIAGELKHDS